MLVKISGGRGDGSVWPDPGGEIEVDGAEGTHLCQAHLAVPVAETRKAETPEDTLQVTEETRGPKPRSTRGKS